MAQNTKSITILIGVMADRWKRDIIYAMVSKKHKWFSVRSVLMLLTVILVAWVVYQNWPDILETLQHIREANGFVLMLLIPEQLFMYFACGQIFFSYLKHKKNVKKFEDREILKISTELNFVNHAIPAGGVGGLAFLTYRLRPYGVTAGQASFLYLFRYAVTTVVNYAQALVAIGILLALRMIPRDAMWIIPVSLLMNMGVFFFLWFVIFVASSSRRISIFSKTVTKLANLSFRILTFGRKHKVMEDSRISNYFQDIHQSVLIAKNNKKYLKKPIIWGLIYSLCEIGTYYIVALSLGRWELLPFIMVGETIGSVFDGIVPYGLYELGMAGVMIALGVDFPTATIITVMTRVITLLFTIASGSYPYYEVIRGKDAN